MTLAHKGAKSRTRIGGLRSKTTKAKTHVDRLRAANADLKKKLAEALDQQTATSEVLQVLSTSPGGLEPVFQTMLANAVRICEAKIGTLYIREGDGFRTVATHNAPPAYVEARTRKLIRPPPDATLGRVAATKQVVHIADITTIPSYLERNPFVVTPVELGGYRTTLGVPMLKDGQRANRRDHHQSPGGVPVHRQADRSAEELRRAGGHRHREHPLAERAAPAHERLDRSTRAADRDLGGAACYFELAGRARAGVFSNAGKCHAHLRGQLRKSIPS